MEAAELEPQVVVAAEAPAPATHSSATTAAELPPAAEADELSEEEAEEDEAADADEEEEGELLDNDKLYASVAALLRQPLAAHSLQAHTLKRAAQQERLRRINVRKHLMKLLADMQQREAQVAQTQQQVAAASATLARLQHDMDRLDEQMDAAMANTSVADEKLKLQVQQLQKEQDRLAAEAEETAAAHKSLQQQLADEQGQLAAIRTSAAELAHVDQELRQAMAEGQRADQLIVQLRTTQERQRGQKRAQNTVREGQLHAQFEAELAMHQHATEEAIAASRRRGKELAAPAHALRKAEQQSQAEEAQTAAQRKLASLQSLKTAMDIAAQDDKRRAIAHRKFVARDQARQQQEAAELLAQGENPELVFKLRAIEEERRKRAAVEAQRRQQQCGVVAERLQAEASARRQDMQERGQRLRAAMLAGTASSMHHTIVARQGPKAPRNPAMLGPAGTRKTLKLQVQPTIATRSSHHESMAGDSLADDDYEAQDPYLESAGSDRHSLPGPGDSDDGDDDERWSENGLTAMETTVKRRAMKQQAALIPDVEAQAQAVANLDFGDSEEEDLAGGKHGIAIRDPFNPDGVAAAALGATEYQGLWDAMEEHRSTVTGSGMAEEKSMSTSAAAWADEAQIARQASHVKGAHSTLLEQRTLAAALARQKENIVQKQIVAGREFSGPPFVSKPSKVVFKDYDANKVYRQRITLTNVSYTVNSFQLLPTPSEEITYEYSPSGGLSPGLSIDLIVIFQPKLMRDIHSEIRLLAQTGPFSIPLLCTRKRCAPAVSSTLLDFGQMWVGEQATRSLQISNKGALATRYTLSLESVERHITDTPVPPSMPDLTKHSGDSRVASAGSAFDAPVMAVNGQPLALQASASPVGPPPAEASPALDMTPATKSEQLREKSEVPPSTSPTAKFRFSLPATTEPGSEAAQLDVNIESALEGFLAPRSEVTVAFSFKPSAIGTIAQVWRLHFDDPDNEDLFFRISAQACSVPVFLGSTQLDLLTCMEGHVYAADVLIHNTRPTGAAKISFTVPPEARHLLELKPRTALVPSKGVLKVEACLTPQADCLQPLVSAGMANLNTGRMAVPVLMQTEGQAQAATLVVCAHVTSAQIEVSVDRIDFGRVQVTQSAIRHVTLTNTSALAQPYGFVNLPPWLTVQPGDGFGVLLPFEKIVCDVIFSPPRHPHDDDAQQFSTTIIVEQGNVSQGHRIRCSGVGVVPALSLSSNHVRFPVTCLGDFRTASVTLVNHSTVARRYHVALPPQCPVHVSPISTLVPAKSRAMLWLKFTPTLDMWDPEPTRPQPQVPRSPMKVKTKKPVKTQQQIEQEKLQAEQAEHNRRQGLLDHMPLCQRVTLPIFVEQVSSEVEELGASMGRKRQAGPEGALPTLSASMRALRPRAAPGVAPDDTLRLELELPMGKPMLVVDSDGIDDAELMANCSIKELKHDFGQVGLGARAARRFLLRNVSKDMTLKLKSNCLEPLGVFYLPRRLRAMPPGATQVVVVKFAPQVVGMAFDVLELTCAQQTLRIKLYGEGVQPSLQLKVPATPPSAARIVQCLAQPPLHSNHIVFSDCVPGAARTETMTLTNASPFALTVRVSLADGADPDHHCQPSLGFNVLRSTAELKRPGGAAADVANLGSLPAFECSPRETVLEAGASKTITVTFRPDRPAWDYRSTIFLEYGASNGPLHVDVRGRCCPAGPYFLGADRINLTAADNPLAIASLLAGSALEATLDGGQHPAGAGAGGTHAGGASGNSGGNGNNAGGGGGGGGKGGEETGAAGAIKDDKIASSGADASAAAGGGVGGGGGGGAASNGADAGSKTAGAATNGSGEAAGGAGSSSAGAAGNAVSGKGGKDHSAADAAGPPKTLVGNVTLVYSLANKVGSSAASRDVVVGVTSSDTKRRLTADVTFESFSTAARALGFTHVGTPRLTIDQDSPAVLQVTFNPSESALAAGTSTENVRERCNGANGSGSTAAGSNEGRGNSASPASTGHGHNGGKTGKVEEASSTLSLVPAAAVVAAGGLPTTIGAGTVITQRLTAAVRCNGATTTFVYDVVLKVVE